MRIPREGDLLRLTKAMGTIDEDENEVVLDIGYRVRVARVRWLGGSQKLQFEMQPGDDGLASIFIDELNLVNGEYPFEFVGFGE